MTEEKKKQMGKGMAVAAMVCGIVSIVFFWSAWFGLVLAILGLVFGIVSLAKKSEGKGMAIAGVATGGVGLIASVLFILFVIFAVTTVVEGVTESITDKDGWKQLEEWSNNYSTCLEQRGIKDKDYDEMNEIEQEAYWECFTVE